MRSNDIDPSSAMLGAVTAPLAAIVRVHERAEARRLHLRLTMGTKTDSKQLINDLNRALPLLARDAAATAMAAGTLPGPEGVALSARLREVAADEIRDVERVAARITSLGGSAALSLEALQPPKSWAAAVKWLVRMQHETLDAVVEAIPADADDAEGEATEHLLEHVVARKRDAVEILERALR